VDTDNTFSKTFRKGQVLFGRRRAYLKKAAVAPCDGICSGDITVIAAKQDALTPELLPFIIQNDRFFDFAVEKSAGSLSPRAKWEHLRGFEFELPSMAEQRRLAEALWAFDDTRQAYKKLLKLTDDLVKSQFVEMFGEPVSNPMGWDKVSLAEACKLPDDIKCGPFGTQLRNADYQREGVAVYAIPQVNSAFQKAPTDFLTDEKATQLGAFSLTSGDIAMSRKGNVGTCAIFPATLPDGIIHSDVLRIRVNSERVNPVFLIAQLNSQSVTRQIELVSQGAIMAGTNVTKLKGITIELPPLALQHRFADFARQADKSKFELNRTLDELDAAYKALVRERLG
jgi:type I restriction enzyme S subunit